MPLVRFTLDLAIPFDVYNSIPATKKIAVRDAIRALKAYAVKINAGTDSEEMTVRATYHICHHDTGDRPCEPESEI